MLELGSQVMTGLAGMCRCCQMAQITSFMMSLLLTHRLRLRHLQGQVHTHQKADTRVVMVAAQHSTAKHGTAWPIMAQHGLASIVWHDSKHPQAEVISAFHT